MPRTIATTDRVERDELLDFVRPRHNATLVTIESWGPIARGGFPPEYAGD